VVVYQTLNMSTLDYILKKFDLKITENPLIEIPNVGRNDLPKWLRELDFKTGVEVGVATGKYSEIICIENPQMKVYGVDPWEGSVDYKNHIRKEDFNKLYTEAKERMAQYPNYEIIRETSEEALKRFDDESLDFVYLDANHEEPYISQDIAGWDRKLKPGGILAGHDYIRPGSARRSSEDAKEHWDVIAAVNKYIKKKGINPWFLIGLNAKILGMIRDNTRSWMWIK